MKKLFMYLKVWGNDYTPTIYFLKIAGLILTLFYFLATFGNRQKAKQFNQKRNYFVKKRIELILKRSQPLNDAFNAKFLKGDWYQFKDIFLPKIKNVDLMRSIYDDTLSVYVEHDDNYSYAIVDTLEKKLPEGTYCYISKDGEEILVKKDAVVVDAGAWAGDFSMYAARKGAKVYAFEPSPINIKTLQKTIEKNGVSSQVSIIPFGLGEKAEVLDFFENEDDGNTGGNTFNVPKYDANTKIEITTLDNWVEKNNIKKIDFIKSDVEGYERHLLRGATKVLSEFAPILSICTYHFPEDKYLLKEIILKANPKYIVLQRKMKLFAYVPKETLNS